MPVFEGERIKSAKDLANPLLQLEFGHELGYFRERGAAATEGPVIQGRATLGYALEVGDSRLYLFTAGTPERPLAVIKERDGSREVFRYTEYEQLQFDPNSLQDPRV